MANRPTLVYLTSWMLACLIASSALAQRAAPSPAADVRDCGPRSVKLDKTQHLRLAAEHLQAAGKVDLARQILLAEKEELLRAKLDQLTKLQAEVDQLRRDTGIEQTVVLHVKVLELQVTKMRRMGFDFQVAGGSSFDCQQIRGDTVAKLVTSPEAIAGLLEALRQHGLVKVLAEPTLMTISGRSASFQSGGEFPVLVPQSQGHVSVEFRQFGTRLDCVPVVLGGRRIRLEVRPTISELDRSNSVVVQNVPVPGLRTRTLDTAVEMNAGQTLVLGGLVRAASGAEDDAGESEETALLVTVTASLGAPAAIQARAPSESDRR